MTVLPGEPVVVRQRLLRARSPRCGASTTPYLYALPVHPAERRRSTWTPTTVPSASGRCRLDPERGLRINGEPVKLRGACIHHDNGVLGAATIARAEERRVEILKDAGFNAIRSAHNPMSTAMLDACDRLGMLVMDEAFDMWTEAKSDFDYALRLPRVVGARTSRRWCARTSTIPA